MNLTEAALKIDSITAVLRADNDAADRILREQRRHAEAQFKRSIRDYVLNETSPSGRQFFFGGVCNLLTTVASICAEISQLEGDDWEKAAELIDDCADACDLTYMDPGA